VARPLDRILKEVVLVRGMSMNGTGRGRLTTALRASLLRRFRLTAALGAVVSVGLMVGVVVMTLPSTASAVSGGGLKAKPWAHLTNDKVTVVWGPPGLTPGDEVVLKECLRTATDLSGCDPATASEPITVAENGKLPATNFTVVTGEIGTGTCGTSSSDAKNCEIAAQDVTGAALFEDYVNVRFATGPHSTTTTTFPVSTTLPTLPSPTVPSSVPTSLPVSTTLPSS